MKTNKQEQLIFDFFLYTYIKVKLKTFGPSCKH